MGTKRTGNGASRASLVKVGRIGKLFGTDGGLTFSLYEISPDDISIEEPLWVIIDSLAVPLFAEYFERKGRSGALVRFADIDTTQRAEEMIGLEVFLKTVADSDGDGELYFEDLEGYGAVVKEAGRKDIEGKITAYVDSDLNPLFVVDTPEGEVLIPAADDFIEEVDVEKRNVIFVLPEGLLDLNS